jgi:hypothetical protein
MRFRRSVIAAIALVVALGAGSAYAAFSARTSPPAASFTGAPDWTPPALTATAVQKGGATAAGWSAGYVKPGGQYYVYAQVAADTGSPASGLASPLGDLSALTSGQTAASFGTAGSYSSQGSTYNYRAGPFTVSAAEGSANYTVTTRDLAGNAVTSGPQAVTVDGTKPTGSSVQTARSGGTAGVAETGDSMTFTFSEPIDPASVLSGWDGTSRNVTFRIVDGGGGADTVQLWTTSRITTIGTVTLPDKKYVKRTVDFTNSPMVMSGSTLTVTLGSTASANNVTTGSAGSTKWVPTTSLYDRAGNALTSTTITETGSSDAEF